MLKEGWLFFKSFIKQNKLCLIGSILLLVTVPPLTIFALIDSAYHVESHVLQQFFYLGLFPLMLLGLALFCVGIFISRQGFFSTETIKELVQKADKAKVLKETALVTSVILTVVLICMGAIVYSAYHYTESVNFCGKLCHKVMTPEFTAYKHSPHAHVKCVECHIGPGASWFVKSKLNGMKEVVEYLTNTYPKPLPTPLHNLRPARETCEECHRPEHFIGYKFVIKEKRETDENNSKVYTVLLMKTGTGGMRAQKAHGIHWHVSPDVKIYYKYTDEKRENIVEVIKVENGQKTVFKGGEEVGEGHIREMDCLDCHNRPTHIFHSAEEALDLQFVSGAMPEDLPFIKKVALEAITKEYSSREEAEIKIAEYINNYYQNNYPDIFKNDKEKIDKAIKAAREAYLLNVFPEMNISWNTYTNFLGHDGCFRCHNEELESADGEVIPQDCSLCHNLLAEEEENPEILETILGE
ncbi:NapC/NirT family cytochrome c [Thermosulfurimonas dismutans]|uniref:Cytochrome c family protein, multiheme n=1 Tax=Thermosulfurimonas dismutans TaxID=999894 RepID=A0A179D3Q3_9BACT|nr:NapC/NirT family cytochrome c [Thermosulfurimonas dismutans]OAQ20685.1 Cytochrome c family protein, multiheme [Thermosulfurimonas dismutans]